MNEIMTQQEFFDLKLKSDHYAAFSNKINESLKSTTKNFVEIGYYLSQVRDEKLYEIEGYSDIYDYSNKVFGISKTTTSNFIGIFEKFGQVIGNEYYKTFEIKNEYQGFSLSKLIELLPVKDEDLSKYKETMSVSEIRSVKSLEKIDETVKEFMVNNNEVILYIINKLNKYLKANFMYQLKYRCKNYDEKVINKMSDYFVLNGYNLFSTLGDYNPVINLDGLTWSYKVLSDRKDIKKEYKVMPFGISIDFTFDYRTFLVYCNIKLLRGNEWSRIYQFNIPDNFAVDGSEALESIGSLDEFCEYYLDEFINALLYELKNNNEAVKEKVDYSQYNRQYVSKVLFKKFNNREFDDFSKSKISKIFDLDKCRYMTPDANYNWSRMYLEDDKGNKYRVSYNKVQIYDEKNDREYSILDMLENDDVLNSYKSLLIQAAEVCKEKFINKDEE